MSSHHRSIQGPEHSGRVYPYRAVEERLLSGLPAGARILDLGCSEGANLTRLAARGHVIGVDASLQRLVEARRTAPVAAGVGERLPFAGGSFDLVYVSHVLHHASDHRVVLGEIHRVLKPDGAVLIVETFDDNPAVRLARNLRIGWDSDRVPSRFRFEGLISDVERSGFHVEERGQFNVVYWVWDVAQIKVPRLARLVHAAEQLEMAAAQRFRRFSAHGYILARPRGETPGRHLHAG